MSPEGKRQWHISQNRKSQKVRKAKSQERADEIKAYKLTNPEATTREIGKIFNCGRMTVSRALKGMA
jgi:DNA invertase Pin-like site-specific DNA recombinase